MTKTHYQTLDVAETATADEIKRAFRERAKLHHPDRNPGDAGANDRFKEVTAAYEVLGDAQRRAAYDEQLRSERNAARVRAAAAAARAAAERAAATPVPPAPAQGLRAWPQAPAGPGLRAVVAAGAAAIGLGALLSAIIGGNDGGGRGGGGSRRRPSRHWDSSVGRYRGADGRFTSA